MDKIISGGQTGADQAGLDAAVALGLRYGGHVPLGRRTESGPLDAARYPLMTEHTTGDYLERTKLNVNNSDATVVFTWGRLTGGSRRTYAFAQGAGKPVLHVDVSDPVDAAKALSGWLRLVHPTVLNVAGSRASKVKGIHNLTLRILVWALQPLLVEWRQPPKTS